MDLAKIIAELRVELQCLDTAIASIEELARAQNIAEADFRPAREGERGPTEPDPDDIPPVKRRRGRPRKNAPQDTGITTQPKGPGSEEPKDESTLSAA
jgi:hypothetical protein